MEMLVYRKRQLITARNKSLLGILLTNLLVIDFGKENPPEKGVHI